MTVRSHWEEVWAGRDPDQVTWHQAVPERSLRLVESVTAPSDAVVDAGGGASHLVDLLLDDGYRDVTVVDVSASALATARARLGDRACEVTWVVGDVRVIDLGRPVQTWHDRAVFHFLVDRDDQQAYVERVRAHVPVGGHVVIATFAPDGPERCSGLPVQRWDAAGLVTAFGDEFALVADEREAHVAPSGVVQQFQYAVLRRLP